ncbi:MAG: hypothetical protein U1A24_04185 [Cypionkella sp.]|uniref:hypothetical protein n=1 Tax=Cypionkella sp. TaxID=2811411 RepID=UPI002ABBDC5E|nr:hypothetical protein [Cypionkella sp.]MDZ4309744.1 hypothetical protein [Cypionkella sp.]MDZ4393638.1 hypothetical protein [Cypionkella sp.]
MRLLAGLAGLMLLAACDPQVVADKAMRRTAETVVRPVLAQELPGNVAEAATQCVLDAAGTDEIRALARDVGVEAGTLTVQNIRNLATRPTAAACFARNGVPPLRG